MPKIRISEAVKQMIQNGGSTSVLGNRAMNPVNAVVAQNAGDYQENVTKFQIAQTLEQSNLPINKRAAIYQELQSLANKKDNIAVITQKMNEYGLGQRFQEHGQWLLSKGGERFINTQLPSLQEVTNVAGLAPGHVSWQNIKTPTNKMQGFIGQVRSTIASNMGIDPAMVNVHYRGGHEGRFNVSGMGQQLSQVHSIEVNLRNLGTKFSLDLHKPSEAGFLAQSSHTFSRGFTKGESIYVTPESYHTDVKFNKQTQQLEMQTFSGRGATEKFQMSQIEQMSRRMRDISEKNISLAEKQVQFRKLSRQFSETQSRNQFFVESANVLGGSLERAGYSGYTQNLLSRAAYQRRSSGLEYAFSDYRNVREDPRQVYNLMEQRGVQFIGSPQQVAKFRGIMMDDTPAGIEPLPHKQPMKQLRELSPANLRAETSIRPGSILPRYGALYQTNAQKSIEHSLFNPVGTRMVGTIIPETSKLGEKLGLGSGELLAPDGTLLVREDVFKSGALDVADIKRYKVKATGVGSVGGARINETLAALFGGGQVRPAGDPSKLIQIPGLSSLPEDQRSFLGALGMKSNEEFRKTFPGGIGIERDAVLGFDPISGRTVHSAAHRNINEAIVDVSRTSADDAFQVTMARTVQAFEDPAGRQVSPNLKLFAEGIKHQTSEVTEHQFPRLLNEAYKSEGINLSARELNNLKAEFAMPAKPLTLPSTRSMYMAGSIQYELDRIWTDTGKSKEAQRAARKIAQGSNTQLLTNIASGNILQDLSAITDISRSEFSPAKKILSEQSKHSMDKRLAAVSFILFGGLPEEQKMRALGNIFAPYSEFGSKAGVGAFKNDQIVERYFNWGGNTRAQTLKGEAAKAWRSKKTITNELNEAFNNQMLKGGQPLSEAILASQTPMTFLSPAISVGSYDTFLGGMNRATLEPRFFDIALANPNMQSVMKELSSRTTNFSGVLNKLQMSLEGKAPKNVLTNLALQDALGTAGQEMIGYRDLTVNLGLDKNTLTRAQNALEKMHPGMGYKVNPEIYLPGGEDFRNMGLMTTGTGVQKEKPIREIYTNYLKALNSTRHLIGSEQATSIAAATAEFQDEILGGFKTQVMGVPRGESHGVFRAPVKGSAYLPVKGLGGDLLEALGLTSQPTDYGSKGAIIAEQRQNLRANLETETIGRQQFVSSAALNRQFQESRAFAQTLPDKESRRMLQRLKEQREALSRGGSILAPVWRHPGIGPRSMTVARIYEDLTSASSAEQHYVRVAEEKLAFDFERVTGKKTFSQKMSEQVGIAKELAMDHDGDFQNMAIVSRNESQVSLARMMREEYRHSMKYSGMKEVMLKSIEMQGASQQAISQASRNMSSILAHGATNSIVPKVSNTLTELKYIVSQSSLGADPKHSLLAFFELGEQVPISSKHLVNQADFGLDYARQMKELQGSLFDDAAVRNQNINSFFDTLFNKEVAEKVKLTHHNAAMQDVTVEFDRLEMKNNLVKALDEVTSNKEQRTFLQYVRKKNVFDRFSIEDVMGAWGKQKDVLSKIHGHTYLGSQEGAIDLSKRVLSSLNESTIGAGRAAASKLPTKGIVGVAATAAAGVLITGAVGSMALGPTYTDAQSGGAYASSEDLFPEELEHRNAMLHGNSIPTPVSGHLATPNYEATIHMAPGAYMPATLAGRLGSVMGSRIGSARLDVNDHRSSLDTFTLSRIKNEII